MGHHAAIIIDHAIAFNTIEEFAGKLADITGHPYFIQEIDAEGNCMDAPFEFEGWLVSYYEERKNMEDGGLIDFALVQGDSEVVNTFYLGADCLEVNNMFTFDDWDKTIAFIRDTMRGMHNDEWMALRTQLYNFFKPLGTQRMLIFCGSEHEFWLDEIGSHAFTFDVALKYAEKHLKVIDFKNIKRMPPDFFSKAEHYENVCLLDMFEDLQ